MKKTILMLGTVMALSVGCRDNHTDTVGTSETTETTGVVTDTTTADVMNGTKTDIQTTTSTTAGTSKSDAETSNESGSSDNTNSTGK